MGQRDIRSPGENSQKVRVVADHREVGAGVIETLQSLAETEVEVDRLGIGDYAVDESLLFERKTLRDLVISIVDGRFFSQVARMSRSDRRAVLVLEGTSGDLKGLGMRRESVQGALITASVGYGTAILRSVDSEETARLILYAARQSRNAARGSFPRYGYRPRGRRRRQLHILQGLPGIGPKRAEQLLDAFGSVRAVIGATSEELMAVDGIGEGTTGDILSIVRESSPLYSRSNQ